MSSWLLCKGGVPSPKQLAGRTLRITGRCASTVPSSTEATSPTSSSSRTSTTADLRYPNLFRSLDLGPDIGVLPNRVLMGSMHTGLEGHSLPSWIASFLTPSSHTATHDSDHHSLSRMATYFATRARGHVGLMVTGGIAPSRAGWTGPFSSQLLHEREVARHRVVTDAVHAVPVPLHHANSTTTVPARICLQILHTGRYAYHPFAVSASNTKSPISMFRARALTKAGVQQTVRDFVHTAVLAKQAGYDGVEVMGSEGYLLSQFLSPRTNQRTDDYGNASLANRARLALEIVQQTRAAVGNDFIIIFRLSLLDLVQDGLAFEESLQLATWLQDAGCTILNTGIGWHEARVPTISTTVPRAAFAFPTHALKAAKVVDIPIVATNRINHPQTAEDLLLNDTADLVSMARPFLADPYLLRKAYQNRPDEINTCIGCNQACLDHVFVGKTASCLVNPRACHETELPSVEDEEGNSTNTDHAVNDAIKTDRTTVRLPSAQRLRIGVVGAGPAGCAFSLAAAQRGHDVTLYDQQESVGGQFHMAKKVPGKEEFHETLRYFRTMLEKEGVRVQLDTTVSFQDMERDDRDYSVDKWVIATGVTPRDPKIPGQDHSNVLSYIDVLKHRKPVGKRVAIIGAGGIGFDVAEYLLHHGDGDKDLLADEVSKEDFWRTWGIDTTLQTRGGLVDSASRADIISTGAPKLELFLLQRKKGKLGKNLGKTTGWIHRATLAQSQAVTMLDGVAYEKIDEDGHLHVTLRDGQEQRVLPVDTIVVCAGQVEHHALQSEATEVAPGTDGVSWKDRVYTIGGAYAAGELDAKRAIDMGVRLAHSIHDPHVVPGEHVSQATPGVEERLYQLLRRFA